MSEPISLYSTGQSIRIAEWWMPKVNQMLQGQYHAVCFDTQAVIVKEREKSCQVKVHGFEPNGAWEKDITFWCPKRCLQTEDQYQDYERKKAKTLLYQHRAEQYDHDKLLAFAKEHQVYAAKNMKNATILRKIEEARLTYDEP